MDEHNSKYDIDVRIMEEDRPFCDTADAILQIMVEKKFSYGESLHILEKVKKTIESSVKTTIWGEHLTCGTALDTAPTYHPTAEVVAEINRRKNMTKIV
jgi:hypothetical protein